ncbi:hypothetical protein ABT061_01550 [Streptosporangium sp. NPDC002544]|uniref:hypothetical protein n=1 Tax=Streptosporangium sp. NPDC002544 TaxID=3154538 RepID=UPI003331957B
MNNRPEPTEPHDRPQLAEIHDWPELREIRDDIPPPPGPEIVRAALMRAALDGLEAPAAPEPSGVSRASRPSQRTSSPHLEAAVRGLHRARALLAMEARLVHPMIWLVSVVTVVISVFFTLTKGPDAGPLLALAASLIAMVGAAASYGPGHDDAFELVAVTPTSPRVILLARVTLVFGYDLVLALAASTVLSSRGAAPAGLTSLIMSWLGPMVLLAAFTLLLSVCWNPTGAMSSGLAVWTAYALCTTTELPVIDVFRPLWTTTPATVALALALLLAAVIAAGTGEPIRRARATHRP